jgi:hypothetical protein
VIAVAGGAFFVWWRRQQQHRGGGKTAVELVGGDTGGNNNRPPEGVGPYHEVSDGAAIKWHYANRELGAINYPVEIATSNSGGHEMEA